MFTHGGLIASFIENLDENLTEMPSNGSVVGVSLRNDKSGEPEKINFQWDFPYIEEDI